MGLTVSSNEYIEDYPWDQKLQETLYVPGSSNFFSILFFPKASGSSALQYNNVEDTVAHANAWLEASEMSGVPIIFVNIQTETLLTKISGDRPSIKRAGSLDALSNMVNESIYGFEDHQGIDIGIVRAVRLWYAPLVGEYAVEIKAKEGDGGLGFDIKHTQEGFLYISPTTDGEVDTLFRRSSLRKLYDEAKNASRLLVLSRLPDNVKALPEMVTSTGSIKFVNPNIASLVITASLVGENPVVIHVLSCEPSMAPMPPQASSSVMADPREVQPMHLPP